MPASFAVGWRQVCACFMLLAASGMIAATYSIVAVPLGQEFHPTRTVLMLTHDGDVGDLRGALAIARRADGPRIRSGF